MSNRSEQNSQDSSSQEDTQQPTTQPNRDSDGFEDSGPGSILIEDSQPLPLPKPEISKRLALSTYGLGAVMLLALVAAIFAGAYALLVAKPVPESYNHPGYLGAPPILPVPMPQVTPGSGEGATPMPQLPVPDGNAL